MGLDIFQNLTPFKNRTENGDSAKEVFNELVQMEPFDKFPAQFESLKEEYLERK